MNHGVENIKALATLIESQAVIFDFQYNQTEMPIHVPVVVLSTERTLLKNTIHVPVQPASEPDPNLSAARLKLHELK